MYGYIYLTTNLVNGRKYVGQHKSSVFTESYKGSGKLVRQAFEKYGWDNFKVELLEECNSKEDLDRAEINWISKLSAVYSDEYYNIAFGGNSRHGPISDEQKKALSEFGKTRTGEKNPFYGKHHSPETIQKIKDANASRTDFSSCGANRGKVVVNNGEVEIFISPGDEVPEGFSLGRKPFSESHCKSISDSHKGMVRSEEYCSQLSARMTGEQNYWYGKRLPDHVIQASIKAKQTLEFSEKMSKRSSQRNQGRTWMNDGIHNKFVKKSEIDCYLSEGYSVGRLVKFQEGTVWITNGISNKRISADDIIPDGWWRGSTQRRKVG